MPAGERSLPATGVVVVAALLLMTAGCKPGGPKPIVQPMPVPSASPAAQLSISSSAFTPGGFIPAKYTCDGENISPPLAWSSGPAATRSWALIVEDPDAPGGMWTHWVLFDLPASAQELAEHQPGTITLENGAAQGLNDFKKPGYGGPCPPGGTHRYVFRLFAVDTVLPLALAPGREALLDALKGHVLAEGDLTGKYSR